jgi:hypothetical protein
MDIASYAYSSHFEFKLECALVYNCCFYRHNPDNIQLQEMAKAGDQLIKNYNLPPGCNFAIRRAFMMKTPQN